MNITNAVSCSSIHRPWFDRLPILVLEAGLVLAWSSGFIGARFSIDYSPPLLVVFWRCALICLVLLPFVAKALRNASAKALLQNAGIGFLAMTGYLWGVVQGIALGVPAGLAALLADMLPIGMALLTTVMPGHRLSWRVWLGLGTGLVGVILVGRDALTLSDAPLWTYSLPLLGMGSLALATLWRKQLSPRTMMALLPNLWLQCAVSAIAFGVHQSWQGSLVPQLTAGLAISVLWTAAVSTVGGYGLYWLCLRRSSATRVASVLYLSPAVTLVWAWVAFGEPLSWLMAVGTAISVLGVWIVVRAERESDKQLNRNSQ
ncbi:Drug/metabolite transporter superfamily permease [Pseudomonas sp. IT-347P]|uniref:DMT family transporter n=1 Tax=Pseudomonas sp. IT-347P TaxID=3026458 RepID=UPI0039DFFDB8